MPCKNNIYHELSRNLCYFTIPTRLRFRNIKNSKTLKVLSIKLILAILLIMFLLITVINSSLLNPGPATGLCIFYQNVQGLIPSTELNKNHPCLDNTKISEMHAFIYDKQPDIIILNETWLKDTILDHEILPGDQYKIYRRDRSEDSHPLALDNPQKFRRNGGGVFNYYKSFSESILCYH